MAQDFVLEGWCHSIRGRSLAAYCAEWDVQAAWGTSWYTLRRGFLAELRENSKHDHFMASAGLSAALWISRSCLEYLRRKGRRTVAAALKRSMHASGPQSKYMLQNEFGEADVK